MAPKNKLLYLLFVFLVFLIGCSPNKEISIKPNIPANEERKSIITDNQVLSDNEIPFNYIFTGFVTVKNINDIPIDTITFSSQKEWETFKERYLRYEIPYSGYNVEPVDFNEQMVVYYSVLDAKADVYCTASQIDNVKYENDKIKVELKPLDNNLKIISVNREDTGHRYVIVFAIDKKYLSK